MSTVINIPGRRAGLPWRPMMLGLLWLISILVVGGILGWLLFECRDEVEALEQEIVALNTEHAAAVTGLVARIEELDAETAALEETIAEQDIEVAYLTGERERLLAQNDVLLARLNACLDELSKPRPVQEVLPGLISSGANVVVIDDSGSMSPSIADVREGLRGIMERGLELPDAQISILAFGTAVERLFGFTKIDLAPWDYAIDQVDANMGGTNIHLALETAYNDVLALPQPEKQIILLTDGQGDIAPELIRVIAQDNIRIVTVPFGAYANYALLQQISDETGGRMRRAN